MEANEKSTDMPLISDSVKSVDNIDENIAVCEIQEQNNTGEHTNIKHGSCIEGQENEADVCSQENWSTDPVVEKHGLVDNCFKQTEINHGCCIVKQDNPVDNRCFTGNGSNERFLTQNSAVVDICCKKSAADMNGCCGKKEDVAVVCNDDSKCKHEHGKRKQNKGKKNNCPPALNSNILDKLKGLPNADAKLSFVCQLYSDLLEEQKTLNATSKQNSRKIENLTKEKDMAVLDYNKVLLSRSRLENLCRELQRQNKLIKEESLQRIKDEEVKRKEVSEKFKSTIGEMSSLMKRDGDATLKLMDDNVGMTAKLKNISEQHEIRERQIEQLSKQMIVESQLHEAKLNKLKLEMDSERETLLRDKEQLLLKITEYQNRCHEQQNIEIALRKQISVYSNKYEEFQTALTRSNSAFTTFKSEMENMSQKIIRLESETANWKHRWEKTQTALEEMACEKKKAELEIATSTRQLTALHKLCSTLQLERTHLSDCLKKANINPIPTPVANNDLPDKKTCSKAKKSLKKGQNTPNDDVTVENDLPVPTDQLCKPLEENKNLPSEIVSEVTESVNYNISTDSKIETSNANDGLIIIEPQLKQTGANNVQDGVCACAAPPGNIVVDDGGKLNNSIKNEIAVISAKTVSTDSNEIVEKQSSVYWTKIKDATIKSADNINKDMSTNSSIDHSRENYSQIEKHAHDAHSDDVLSVAKNGPNKNDSEISNPVAGKKKKNKKKSCA